MLLQLRLNTQNAIGNARLLCVWRRGRARVCIASRVCFRTKPASRTEASSRRRPAPAEECTRPAPSCISFGGFYHEHRVNCRKESYMERVYLQVSGGLTAHPRACGSPKLSWRTRASAAGGRRGAGASESSQHPRESSQHPRESSRAQQQTGAVRPRGG